MQSCKLWHYLCWHRGKVVEDERRAGVEMREGENKEKGCGKKEDKPTHTHTHTRTHTHTLRPEVNEKDYAWPYPVGPVRFISNIKGLSAVSSPIHQCPVWVSVWSESWMEAGSGELKDAGGAVCVCVCVCVCMCVEEGVYLKRERLPGHTGPWHSPPSGIPGCNGSTSPR